MFRLLRRAALLAAACLILGGPGFSQSIGGIKGKLSDADGKPVKDAVIVITRKDMKGLFKTTSELCSRRAMSLSAKTFRSNTTGVAADRGVRSRYVPVVFATIQLSRTSTPSLSLKPMPMPAGPRAPARTLPST